MASQVWAWSLTSKLVFWQIIQIDNALLDRRLIDQLIWLPQADFILETFNWNINEVIVWIAYLDFVLERLNANFICVNHQKIKEIHRMLLIFPILNF